MADYVLFNGVDARESQGFPWVPLSILTVGSAIAPVGEVIIIDPQTNDDWEQKLGSELEDAKWFGVTSLTGPSLLLAIAAAAVARRERPDIPVLWGGYHASLTSASLIREGHADIVVRGFGEQAAIELAALAPFTTPFDTSTLKSLSSIPGISFAGKRTKILPDGSTAEEVIDTPISFTLEMDLLPRADYELLDIDRYVVSGEGKLPYISSYGCPHACTYCSEPTHSGRTYLARSPQSVAAEVERLWNTYTPGAVDFMDPDLSGRPRRVVYLVDELIARRTDVRLMCAMRARDVAIIARMTAISMLRKAGFVRVFLGVETGSDRMLKRLRKGSTLEDTKAACTVLAAAGIETHTSFMHDLPDETPADSAATIELVEWLAREVPGNTQYHHFFTPFPGTTEYSRAVEEPAGGYSSTQWADSDTYSGSVIWRGRGAFRSCVVAELERVRERYPVPFQDKELPAP
ncbi:MAG: B12-binding domain-containing radical SAM protein [bacterium]|nr:B12-binding domain-containing radical SAM protein [bacterium]